MRYINILLATFILLAGCRASGPQRLIIISTNDIHSSIDNFPSLATLVDDYRSRNGVSVLVVDAGDRWTGNPYVDMAPEQYKPVIELMNAVGYDIATFGNHEWDNGINLLAKRTSEAGFIKLLTNASGEDTPLDMTIPYHIADADGLRVGFTGLITNFVNGHPDGKLENFGGMEFFDPWETADAYAWLADSVDLVVAVTHIGFREDSLMAVRRPEIDLIIGGHSHTLIPEGLDIEGTVVTQTGKNLVYAGITEITHRGGKVEGITNRLVMLDTVARKPAIAQMVEDIYNEPELKRPIGELAHTMDKIALMNLFSDAMRRESGASFAFHNMGGMRIDSLARGPILKGDVYAAEPFGNTIVVVTMHIDDIASMILDKFNSAGKESHTLDLYPSGLTYRIITDAEGNATDIFFRSVGGLHTDQGEPLPVFPDRKDVYLVALSDYVESVYSYPRPRPVRDTGLRIAAAAERYIDRYKNPIQPDSHNRVTIE